MKSISKILAIFLLFSFLISCDNDNGKKAFENDYQMFKDVEHVYVKSDYETVYNALTEKEGYSVIIFAYDPNLAECPFCIKLLPIINEVALDVGVEEILYLDIRTMRVNRSEEYLKLINYISNQIDDLDLRNNLVEIIVPDIYVVKNGEILGHHIATVKNEEGKYILNINDDQLLELETVYENLLSKVKS